MLYAPELHIGTEVTVKGRGSVGSVNWMPSRNIYALAGFRNFTNEILATEVVDRG